MPVPSALSALAEVRAIDALAAGFPRHPGQLNAPHTADCELIPLAPGLVLALSLDQLTSEWETGLFRDPFTAGWVLVQGALSDLAAVGADALGLLLGVALPAGADAAFTARFKAGLDAALAATGTPVLGGDLGGARSLSLAACAVGTVSGARAPLTRAGIRPGDEIHATGPLGGGIALAMVRMLGLPEALAPESDFRPVARLAEGVALAGFARAAIDTSDGPLNALDQLARVNGLGFAVDFDLDALVEPGILARFRGAGAPTWPLLCGELGEYELLVAVAPEDAGRLKALCPAARRLAVARPEPGLTLGLPDGREVAYDAAHVRNLLEETGGDFAAYGRAFAAYGAGLGLG